MKGIDLLSQIRLLRLPEPETEVRFHPTRQWRWDLAWRDRKLAVEVEGGVFTGGRHTRPVGFTEDCRKYSEGAVLGWRLLRVTPAMIRDGTALDLIRRALADDGNG